MGQVLNVPVSSKNIERTGSKDLRACSCEMQGYRMTMEDAHTVTLSLGEKHPTKSFFAVFDGHGGDKASIFMSKKLGTHVAKLEDPHKKESLVKCLQELDAEFLKGSEEDREHGSTAVFAVVEQKQVDDEKKWKITVGNLGDSRAIIIRSDGKCESLTKDHKPENKDEERRISAAGGFVRANRVDGQLAMSRAIGDSKYKENHGLPPTQQKVIAVPDVDTFEASSGDRLLLYCDGIVEQMTNEDVAKYVHEQLSLKDKPDPGKILAGLVELSLEKGSKDNMSVLMVMFEDGSDYKSKQPEFIAGPYHRYQDDQNFKKAYLDDAKKHGFEGERLFSMARKTEESMPERPLTQDTSTVSLAFLQNFMKPENENKLNQLLTMFMAGGPEETQEDPDMEPKVTPVDDEPETTSTTTTSAASSATTSTTSSTPATSGTSTTPGKKKKKKKKSVSTAASSS